MNLISITTVLLISLASIALSEAKEPQPKYLEKSFSVEKGGKLNLDTISGATNVVSHSSDTVEVIVEKNGVDSDNFEVVFSQDGNNVTVEGRKRERSFNLNLDIRFTVKVPQEYDVKIKTVGGSIALEALTGKVNVHTSGGSVNAKNITGETNIKTSGGAIKIEGIDGHISAGTSGGNVSVKLNNQPKQDIQLSTSGGNVIAYLIPNIAVDLYAKTTGGSASSEFTVIGDINNSRIDGKINGGGPMLNMETSGGNVRVKNL